MTAPFTGFDPADLAFLSNLAVHNDRDWFTANRAVYEAHADGPLAPSLKRLQWYARRPLTAAELASPDLPDVLAGFVGDMMPLLAFGWGALD